jgi:hypothetical protein
MMRSLKVLAVVGLAVALVGLLITPAFAQARKVVEVVNSTRQAVSTLTITFTGTGVSDFKVTDVKATTCSAQPAPTVNIQVLTVIIQWPNNCVEPNATVSFIVSYWTTAGPLGFGGGNWQTTPPGPQPLPVQASDVTIRSVPTLTEWGLIVLAVLLASSLAWMIRRRFAPRPAGA